MYGYGLNSDFQKRNVAIYARVSTEHDAQLSALENQVDWYRPILSARPDWTLVGQYIKKIVPSLIQFNDSLTRN